MCEHGCVGTFVWTNWVLVVFQLVFPQDAKLTEKEVTELHHPHMLLVFCAVLIVCLWADFGRRAASVTCPSQTHTQVNSAPQLLPAGLQECLTAHVLFHVQGCLGDTQFSFRFRQSVGRRALKLTEDIYNRDAPVSLQVRNLLMDVVNTGPLMTSSHTVLLS